MAVGIYPEIGLAEVQRIWLELKEEVAKRLESELRGNAPVAERQINFRAIGANRLHQVELGLCFDMQLRSQYGSSVQLRYANKPGYWATATAQ